MSFQEAFETIKAGIGDLTQLNVRTFTGKIKLKQGAPLDKSKTFDQFLAENVDGEVQIVGFTDMKLDGDVDQFITSDDFPQVITAHNSAIQTGQQSRKAMLDLFADAIKKGISAVT